MSSVEPRDVGLVVEVFLCPSAELLSSFEVGHSYNLFGEEHTLEGLRLDGDGNLTASAWEAEQHQDTFCVRMRKTHTFQLNDDWLEKFNASPFLGFVGWKTKESAGQGPGPECSVDVRGALDLSPFLAGDSSVIRIFGACPEAQLQPQGPNTSLLAEEGETDLHTHLVESCQTIFSSVSASPEVHGYSFIGISVSLSNEGPLLSPSEMEALNPLTITVNQAKRLPGVVGERNKFELQRQFCSHTYAVIQPLPRLCNRVTGTVGQIIGPRCQWKMKSTFLTGHLSQTEIEQMFETEKWKIEVHDRDPVKVSEARWKRVKEASSTNHLAETELQCILDAWAHMGDECTHGIAQFELKCLLDHSKNLSEAFGKTGSVDLSQFETKATQSLQSPITVSKKRVFPKGGDDSWALESGERLLRNPAHYIAEDSALSISLQLYRPHRDVHTTGLPRQFARIFFAFEYRNAALLQSINRVMDQINTRALGEHIQGSLRSHQLSEDEVKRAMQGELDVVCGFQVIDVDCRIIVVEGLAATMNTISESIPRQNANDQKCRILWDPLLSLNDRLYTSFNVDLKKLKLRDPLPVLCQSPEIYNRSKVSQGCFEGLQRLYGMRQATSMSQVVSEHLFPRCSQLLEIESKYGESISLEDIEGVKRPPKRADLRCSTTYHALLQKRAQGSEVEAKSEEDASEAGLQVQAHQPERRKAATDSQNPEFERAIKSRSEKDFMKEQSDLLQVAREQYERVRDEQIRERQNEEVDTRFVYSGQKLQYTELKKEAMRTQLAREKNTHFTYSTEYLSAAVPLVDTTKMHQSKSQWKTARGFVYPAPKQPEDFVLHPHKPSQSRIDALHEPWVENELHPLPTSRAAELPEGIKDFDTIPAHGKALFGGFRAPKFDRKYDNNNIGSHSRLPRGRMHLERDPDFFKSVHLCGEGLAQEREQTKRLEYEKWRSKVVVDSLSILPACGFGVRDRPLQTDKTRDILRGPPRTKALMKVHNSRLPSGKAVPLDPPPLSMFSTLPFEETTDFMSELRKDDPEHFVARTATGLPQTFVSTIHRHAGHPKSQAIRSTRAILPVTDGERTGPRWASASEK